MKLLSVDVGGQWIGLAAYDDETGIVRPLFTLVRRGSREDFERIAEVARDHRVARIIVGLPVGRDGSETGQSETVREFGRGLERIAGLPVVLWDERHTSQEATALLAAQGVTGEDRKAREHEVAAALILEGYVASVHGQTVGNPEAIPKDIAGALGRLTPAQRRAVARVAASTEAEGVCAYLVGGPVRDVLLGCEPTELDCVIEGDALPVAKRLVDAGARQRVHATFGTVSVWLPEDDGELRVDLATARRERYPRPGALPEVEPASLEDDLRRRDFSVNAMAVRLASEGFGTLHDPCGGEHDLQAQRIRTLHAGSFADDPTRIFRAVALESRSGMRMDPETERQARDHLAAGVLATLSGERLGTAVFHALAAGGAGVAERLADLGVWRALGWDGAARATALLHTTEAEWVPASVSLPQLRFAALAACLTAEERDSLAEGLGLDRATRQLIRALASLDTIRVTLSDAERRPSEVVGALERTPVEVVLLAAAMESAPARARARRYLEQWRTVQSALTGDDLLRMGVPEGPVIGSVLRRLRAARLDGAVRTRQEEEALVAEVVAASDEGHHERQTA